MIKPLRRSSSRPSSHSLKNPFLYAREHPLLVHVPHCSVNIPENERVEIILGDTGLRHEMMKMTDRYTDELFDFPDTVMHINEYSRLLFDPERFRDDSSEMMSQYGMGAIYTHTEDGQRLRYISDKQREELLRKYYDPYHSKLHEKMQDILSKFGRCLIIDGHSFQSTPLSFELDKTLQRPSICIGTSNFHTPEAVVARMEKYIETYCKNQEQNVATEEPKASAEEINALTEGKNDAAADKNTDTAVQNIDIADQNIDIADQSMDIYYYIEEQNDDVSDQYSQAESQYANSEDQYVNSEDQFAESEDQYADTAGNDPDALEQDALADQLADIVDQIFAAEEQAAGAEEQSAAAEEQIAGAKKQNCSAFREKLTVKRNVPFAGTMVPIKYYLKDKRVSSVMIEVNRKLYMDEGTGEKLECFDEVKEFIRGLIAEALKAFEVV